MDRSSSSLSFWINLRALLLRVAALFPLIYSLILLELSKRACQTSMPPWIFYVQSLGNIDLKNINQERFFFTKKFQGTAYTNRHKTIINKWRNCGTTEMWQWTWCAPKIDVNTKRKLVMETAKRLTATLKELQQFLACTGCFRHVTTISQISLRLSYWVWW